MTRLRLPLRRLCDYDTRRTQRVCLESLKKFFTLGPRLRMVDGPRSLYSKLPPHSVSRMLCERSELDGFGLVPGLW